jgi:hypothetical protein
MLHLLSVLVARRLTKIAIVAANVQADCTFVAQIAIMAAGRRPPGAGRWVAGSGR